VGILAGVEGEVRLIQRADEEPFASKERSMKRVWRPSLIAASLAAVLAYAGAARASEAHADGSATTKDAACKLALSLARVDVGHGKVTASHCDCVEDKEEVNAPWSCQAFMTYR
jgi:hypothetical protein